MACQAALDMKRLVDQMPHLNVRIGLNTGLWWPAIWGIKSAWNTR